MTAPTGEIALVFTDVQGSTSLWERAPDAMRVALATHDAIMRDEIARFAGYEVKTEGDAFMVAFARAEEAVRWALAVQERLVAAEWPHALAAYAPSADEPGLFHGLRVRIGINVGAPESRQDPTTGRTDYFGPVVNRAARIAAAAHGGQVLVAANARNAAGDLEGAVFTDLGEHKLRDLETPERLFQLLPVALATRRFSAVRTVDARKSNLPAPPGPFVGRDSDLAAMEERLAGGARLLTITGPGGIGKTRLAIRFAQLTLDEYSKHGGVWFCDLAEAHDAIGVAGAIARALDLTLQGDALAQVGDAIAGRGRVLVLLDNFEQVVSLAGTTVGRWTAAAPEARFVVTSQERLALPGEELHELGPLGIERGDDAVRLFSERARAVRRGWQPTAEDSAAIVEIVRALDGIPLAIELAAARIAVLPPAKILERLKKPLDALGSSRAHSRHATLRAALEWSWNLLAPHEQNALAQCSVFHGGFSIEAAEEVVDLAGHSILDVVQSLRDKSLLRAWDVAELGGEMRFGLYTTVHAFAAEKLASADSARARHASHFLRVGAEWAAGVERHGGLEKLRRLSLERDNLAAIFEHAIATKSAETALSAVRVLDPVLSTRGPFSTHLEWLDAALALAANADPLLVARVLEIRGRTRRLRGVAGAEEDLSSALETARARNDRALEASVLAQQGMVAYNKGDLERAQGLLKSALGIAREAVAESLGANVLGLLGIVWMEAGDAKKAREFYDDALAMHRRLGNRRAEGVALSNLAVLCRRNESFAEARTYFEDALKVFREVNDRRSEGNTLGSLAGLHLDQNQLDEAESCYERALSIQRDTGNKRSQAILLGNFGVVRLLRRDFAAAQAWLDRAAKLARETGDRRNAGLYAGYCAAADAYLGNIEASATSFSAAMDLLRTTNDDLFLRAVLVLEAALDEARAAAAERSGDRVSADKERARAREKSNVDRSIVARSEDIRLALRIVAAR